MLIILKTENVIYAKQHILYDLCLGHLVHDMIIWKQDVGFSGI